MSTLILFQIFQLCSSKVLRQDLNFKSKLTEVYISGIRKKKKNYCKVQ